MLEGESFSLRTVDKNMNGITHIHTKLDPLLNDFTCMEHTIQCPPSRWSGREVALGHHLDLVWLCSSLSSPVKRRKGRE